MLLELGTVALGFAAYHVLSHLCTMLKKEPPSLQRTRLGFGLALLMDLFACSLALGFVGSLPDRPWYWPVLALGVVMHAAYMVVFASDPMYRRIHRYENADVFSDGRFVRLKLLLVIVDMACHVFAVWAIGIHLDPARASFAFVVAASVFAILWAKKAQAEALASRPESAPARS